MAPIFDLALSNDNGIFLISDCTGKGKTYYSVEYAREQIARGKKVYIVGPDYVCLENFEKRLKKEKIPYLRLKSKEDNLLDCYNNETFEKIINSPKIDNELKKLLNDCYKATGEYKTCLKNSDINVEYTKACRDKMLNTKQDIKRYYHYKHKSVLFNSEQIKKELSPIFPEKIDGNVQVVLMTIDKLVHGQLDTLEKETSLMTNKYFSDFTIIMDETDSCYPKHLQIKAQQCLIIEDTVNIIQAFYDYNNSPESHRESFEEKDENEYKTKLAKVMNFILEMDKKYNILKNFKIDYENIEKTKIFLQNNNSKIFSSCDFPKLVQIKKGNSYVLTESKNSQDKLFDMKGFIVDINKALQEIFNLIFVQKILFNKKMSSLNQVSIFSEIDYFKFAVEQVFNISKANTSLSDKLATAAFNIQNSIDPRKYKEGDETKYLNIDAVASEGYKLARFNNDPLSNHAYFEVVDFSNTPENDIAWLAKRGNVVMMSGTQLLKTSNNYHFGYLQRLLKDKFYKNSIDEIKRINDKSLFMPIGPKHHFGYLKGDISEVELLLKRFRISKDKIGNIMHIIDDYIKRTDADEYRKRCLYKSCAAFIAFALEKETKTGLVLTNRTGKELEPLFKDIIVILNSCSGIKTKLSNDCENIFYVNAKDFKEGAKEKIHKLIKEDKKVLVISSRNTIGQSVNINYDKDFNFIYLDSPTYIIDPKPQNGYEKIANYYNYQKMKDIDFNVTIDDVERFCTDGYRRRKKSSDSPNNPSDTESVKNKKSAIIIQNLGRLSRTQKKEKNIYVYLDSDIFNFFDPKRNDYEHTELINALIIDLYYKDEVKEKAVIEKNKEATISYLSALNKACNESLDLKVREDNIWKLENIREQIYRRGVFLYKKELDEFEKQYYVKYKKADLYFVEDCGEFCEDLNYFSHKPKNPCITLDYGAVQEALRLPNKSVDECWVLVPKGYNILLGEIGERFVLNFFKNHIPGYSLVKLNTNEFEVCGDFKVLNNTTGKLTDIYVDVKNYQFEVEMDISKFINKKLKNIKKVNPNGKLMVLNCNATKRYEPIKQKKFLIIHNLMINNKPDPESINNIIEFINEDQGSIIKR